MRLLTTCRSRSDGSHGTFPLAALIAALRLHRRGAPISCSRETSWKSPSQAFQNSSSALRSGLEGDVSIPLVGQIEVRGLTVAEAREKIIRSLSNKVYQQRTPDGREVAQTHPARRHHRKRCRLSSSLLER